MKTKRQKFIETQLTPATLYAGLDIFCLSKTMSEGIVAVEQGDFPINFYEFTSDGKPRIVSMPNPSNMQLLFEDFNEIESDLFKWLNYSRISGRHVPVRYTNMPNKYYWYNSNNNYISFINQAIALSGEYAFSFQVDIASYFNSIYSHSIDWLINHKTYVGKLKVKSNLGHKVDKFMRDLKSKQTNGLLIGPNISRVIAEVMGNKIDVSIQKYLDNNIHPKGGYKFIRFVDDIYIFTDQKIDRKNIKNNIEPELEKFNIKLNENKTKSVKKTLLENKLVKIRERQKTIRISEGLFNSKKTSYALFHYNTGKALLKAGKIGKVVVYNLLKSISLQKLDTKMLNALRTSYSIFAEAVISREISYGDFKKLMAYKMPEDINEFDINLVSSLTHLHAFSGTIDGRSRKTLKKDFTNLKVYVSKKAEEAIDYGVSNPWVVFKEVMKIEKKFWGNKTLRDKNGYN